MPQRISACSAAGATQMAPITEMTTALLTSLAAPLALLFSALPKILAFAVILIVGWYQSGKAAAPKVDAAATTAANGARRSDGRPTPVAQP